MMSHSPLYLHNTSIVFPQKICFEAFSTHIYYGQHIGIIGRNGCGKSSMLHMIQGLLEATTGHVHIPENAKFGYVRQVIEVFESMSGGQRFQKSLSFSLAQEPNILCLDEPTNHLDLKNRKSLLKKLKDFPGTIIIVSHDTELLNTCVDTIWDIHEEGKVTLFSGTYQQYTHEKEAAWSARLHQVHTLQKEHKKAKAHVQFEQKRAAQSKRVNVHENDRKLKGALKEKGSQTVGKNQRKLNDLQKQIGDALQKAHLPERIYPKFSISTETGLSSKTLVAVSEGKCGHEIFLIEDIYFQIKGKDRIVLRGDNGSGKSTFLKALFSVPGILKSGHWFTPSSQEIGYLDQHYALLNPELTVFEMFQKRNPGWSNAEIRRYLNDFLFRKNEEVMTKIKTLSGGEKARLSLAHISAYTPKLLILDEVTNNLDLETRAHMIDVLKNYPGALLVVSHDEDFLSQIHISEFYKVTKGHIQKG
jgi:ATPase subunit of ABC transporter with duplicated ATPase domains